MGTIRPAFKHLWNHDKTRKTQVWPAAGTDAVTQGQFKDG
jgi:hypothetical protein